jgi:signal transduction histidine kinase
MTDTVSDRSRKVWFRLAQAGAGFGLLCLFGLDVVMLGSYGVTSSLEVSALVLGTAWLFAFAWFVAHRLGPVPLGIVGLLVGGWSLLLTFTVGAGTSGRAVLGFAESAAMLGMLLVVVRRTRPWLVVLGGGALVLAVGAQPFRIGGGQTSFILALLFVVIGFSVAAVGAYLRSLDSSRRRHVQLVKAEQRAELARDLHDFVAHHVTGIVVQAQGAKIIAAQDPARAVAALEQIERAGAEAMASMRRMVGMLRANGGEHDAPLARPPRRRVRGLVKLDGVALRAVPAPPPRSRLMPRRHAPLAPATGLRVESGTV